MKVHSNTSYNLDYNVKKVHSSQWARNGFEFFEELRQKPIVGMKLVQKVYGKQGSFKS